MSKVSRAAVEYARKLAERYGESLVSVVLYGSAARGDYREGVSDLNLLVLLRSADPAQLRRGTELARGWAEKGNPPPLILSEVEWRDSADVFPIEYSDMLDAHVVLHGIDPFTDVRVDWTHLRLQCEHELKSKQIQLRERYLVSSDDPETLGRLLLVSFPTFLALFRAGLRLAGAPVPPLAAAVIDAIAGRADFDGEPFHEVLRARSDGGAFSPSGDGATVSGYLRGVERTTAWLDGLVEPEAPAA